MSRTENRVFTGDELERWSWKVMKSDWRKERVILAEFERE